MHASAKVEGYVFAQLVCLLQEVGGYGRQAMPDAPNTNKFINTYFNCLVVIEINFNTISNF